MLVISRLSVASGRKKHGYFPHIGLPQGRNGDLSKEEKLTCVGGLFSCFRQVNFSYILLMIRFSFPLPDCVDLACHAAGDHRERPQRPEKLIKRDFGRLPFAMVVMPILHCP